jgi:lipopolysaccharide biosynthesis glycosyltransferase
LPAIPFTDDTNTIVFASSEYFVPYLSTMIQSMIDNSDKKKKYQIFILHKGILEYSVNSIKQQIFPYRHFMLSFIDIRKILISSSLNLSVILNSETYYRLLIPYLFRNYQKVLYLDADMCCQTDVSELFYYDIEDNFIASTRDILAVRDYYLPGNRNNQETRYKKLGIKNWEKCFLASLLVFNIQYFLASISLFELLELVSSKDWDYKDQDVLNILCEDKCVFLPLEWDFEDIGDNVDFLPDQFKKNYLNAKSNPRIIHFPTCSRPWIRLETPGAEYFWKYACKTPFFGLILNRTFQQQLSNIKITDSISISTKRLIKNILRWFLY